MRLSQPRLVVPLLLAAVCISTIRCGGSGSSSPTAPEMPGPVTLSLTIETAHFVLQYSERDADKMDTYAAVLEDNHRRIVRNLDQIGLPKITGRFYPDNAS